MIPDELTLQKIINKMALSVAATEAAFFAVCTTPRVTPALMNLLHIRPGDDDAAKRQRAINAFSEIVQSCIARRLDDAIEVGPAVNDRLQFCLVILARKNEAVVGAATLIIRRPGRREALTALKRAQEAATFDPPNTGPWN